MVIATKFGERGPGLSGGASRAYVKQQVERSLKRLGSDYIDLLYLHRPDKSVPLEETLGAIDELIRAGKVRFAAASNMSARLISEATVTSSKHLHRFIATQEQLNLLERGAESALVPTLQKAG